jgi:lipopolysaccharide exporter
VINLKGEMFTSALNVACTSLIKLVSTLILTRLLYPEAYGIVVVLVSIGFALEMISDLGTAAFLVRHERGDTREVVSTVWTVRLLRSVLNGGMLFLLAPQIAGFYELPALRDSLRIYSITFFLAGLESMSFVLSVRRQNSRINNYCELVAVLLTTTFVIAFSYFRRDHVGMVLGMVLHQLAMTVMSHCFYRSSRPELRWNRGVVGEFLGISKVVAPSSFLTLLTVQFDRLIFLRLFDVGLLGVYGLANNILAPADNLANRLSNSVLYPRCAEIFRTNPKNYKDLYYTQNRRLLVVVMLAPAIMAGAGVLIVETLYDSRYALAGVLIMTLAFRSLMYAMVTPCEVMLWAAGHVRVTLVTRVLRIGWLVPLSLLGYQLYGFVGFLAFVATDYLPCLVYVLYVQRKSGFLSARVESFRAVCAIGAFLFAYAASSALAGPANAVKHILIDLIKL